MFYGEKSEDKGCKQGWREFYAKPRAETCHHGWYLSLLLLVSIIFLRLLVFLGSQSPSAFATLPFSLFPLTSVMCKVGR